MERCCVLCDPSKENKNKRDREGKEEHHDTFLLLLDVSVALPRIWVLSLGVLLIKNITMHHINLIKVDINCYYLSKDIIYY